MTDTILKIYQRGRLAGKYAVFFSSKKAKDLYKSLNLVVVEGAFNIVAGNTTDETLDKVRAFLKRHELTITEVTIK